MVHKPGHHSETRKSISEKLDTISLLLHVIGSKLLTVFHRRFIYKKDFSTLSLVIHNSDFVFLGAQSLNFINPIFICSVFMFVVAWLQVNKGKAPVKAVFKKNGEYKHAGSVVAESKCWSMLKGGLTVDESGPAELYFEVSI